MYSSYIWLIWLPLFLSYVSFIVLFSGFIYLFFLGRWGGGGVIINNVTTLNVFQVRNLIEKTSKKSVNRSELKLPLIRIKVIYSLTGNAIVVACDL